MVKTIEETYQKKSQLEHVLHRPGMYIGDIDKITAERWIISENVMKKRLITFSPGLYKIFDEIFTNTIDHSHMALNLLMHFLKNLLLKYVMALTTLFKCGKIICHLFQFQKYLPRRNHLQKLVLFPIIPVLTWLGLTLILIIY